MFRRNVLFLILRISISFKSEMSENSDKKFVYNNHEAWKKIVVSYLECSIGYYWYLSNLTFPGLVQSNNNNDNNHPDSNITF